MRVFFVILLGVLALVSSNKGFVDSIEMKPKIYPARLTANTSMGYQDLVADILWIRTIQDFDYCENPRSEKAVNLGVTYDQALANKNISSRCNKGWVYQMIDVITELAPRFKKPYTAGAVNLSVAVDDREGARLVFEKGIKQFPDDWTLAYAASYHYLFEIQDPTRAADLLLQANRYGGPSWLPVLASRLYTASGRKELGRSVLVEYLKTNPEGEGALRARKLLDQIESQ